MMTEEQHRKYLARERTSRLRIPLKERTRRERCRGLSCRAESMGIIQRPSKCQGCGRKVFTVRHHEDYDQPLNVLWLCGSCHVRRHKGRLELTEEMRFSIFDGLIKLVYIKMLLYPGIFGNGKKTA